MTRISPGEDSVTWSDFEQPHRAEKALLFSDQRIVVWRHEGLGPFTFERGRYLAELAKPATR